MRAPELALVNVVDCETMNRSLGLDFADDDLMASSAFGHGLLCWNDVA